MAGRTCGTCGASVPILVDVCPRCGTDPDLQLVEVGALDLGRRPPRGPVPPGTGGPRRRRWWPVLAAMALVATVVAVLASAPDDPVEADDEEAAPTTTTRPRFERERPRPPRTTAPTTLPLGPLLGERTGLLVTSSQSRFVLDLDTGVETRVGASILGAHRGRLLVDIGRGLAWWPPPFDGTGEELIGDDVSMDQAWIDAEDGTIWGIAYEPTFGTLVGIGPDGSRYDLALPTWGTPVGVVDGRAVFSAPGGTFAVSVDGDVDLVSTGAAITAGGHRIFVNRCDEQLRCAVEVLSPEGGLLGTLPGIVEGWPQGAVSTDGRLAIAEPTEGGGGMRVRVDDVVLHEGTASYVAGLVWSPDGRWLFEVLEREVRVHDLAGGTSRTIDVGFDIQMNLPVVFVVDAG